MSWDPIREEEILDLINSARQRMNPLERKFWDSVCIDPEKWQQNPFGNAGGGFWAVALIGRIVVWYNDIEDGFNRSRYLSYGTIPANEYWCNQDRLEVQVRQLMERVTTGRNLFPAENNRPLG